MEESCNEDVYTRPGHREDEMNAMRKMGFWICVVVVALAGMLLLLLRSQLSPDSEHASKDVYIVVRLPPAPLSTKVGFA